MFVILPSRAADSVDSRLELKRINEDLPGSYAILLGKHLPSLEAFTVAAWVRLQKEVHFVLPGVQDSM